MRGKSKKSGTRFRIYPQPKFLRGFSRPEVVYVNAGPGTIKLGPEDRSMYVVDAKNKEPYIDTGETPPYKGPRYPPARPDGRGHFDHIKPGTRAFSSAAVFATVKTTLAVWEKYFGWKLPWYFRRKYRRLEVIPRIDEYNNAWSRPGYLECGFGDLGPLSENFDVVAHEVGHTIIRQAVGFPGNRRSLRYRAHEEAGADLIAIISSLHFDSVLGHVLDHSKGNLFSVNELSRVGELSETKQFRKAFNRATMVTVKKYSNQVPDKYKYKLSLPFTGGAFDVLVDIYQRNLVERRAIPKDLARRSARARGSEVVRIQREFGRYFRKRRRAFKSALVEARDYFGRMMARAWDKTPMKGLSYKKVVRNMIRADVQLSGGQYADLIRMSFQRRKILPVNSK